MRLIAAFLFAVLIASPAAAWEVPAEMTVTARVHNEPLRIAKVLDTLNPGDAITILRCVPSGTWCKVRHPGPDGWVESKAFDRFATLRGLLCEQPGSGLFCKHR